MSTSPHGPVKPLTEWADGIGKTIASVNVELAKDGMLGQEFVVIRFTDGTGFFIPEYDDHLPGPANAFGQDVARYFGIDEAFIYPPPHRRAR